jgi:hypothetical protein
MLTTDRCDELGEARQQLRTIPRLSAQQLAAIPNFSALDSDQLDEHDAKELEEIDTLIARVDEQNPDLVLATCKSYFFLAYPEASDEDRAAATADIERNTETLRVYKDCRERLVSMRERHPAAKLPTRANLPAPCLRRSNPSRRFSPSSGRPAGRRCNARPARRSPGRKAADPLPPSSPCPHRGPTWAGAR